MRHLEDWSPFTLLFLPILLLFDHLDSVVASVLSTDCKSLACQLLRRICLICHFLACRRSHYRLDYLRTVLLRAPSLRLDRLFVQSVGPLIIVLLRHLTVVKQVLILSRSIYIRTTGNRPFLGTVTFTLRRFLNGGVASM